MVKHDRLIGKPLRVRLQVIEMNVTVSCRPLSPLRMEKCALHEQQAG
jgi:hypothetical protein